MKRGVISQREADHIRANYGAKLSMIDHWFGRLLDVVDEKQLWADTAVILCTDHGHYLGEKDIFGKPGVPHYEPLGHTPLMIAWPGVEQRRTSALTTNVDIHATIADVFDVTCEQRTHGHSMVPLVTGTARRDPRLGTGRRIRPLGARHRRHAKIRARAGECRQSAAVDVVEPLVDHAGARDARAETAVARTATPTSTTCRAPTCR